MALTKDQREQFLGEPHIAALTPHVVIHLRPQHWIGTDLGAM
ncbi:MAG TPA: hypothetical protein VFR27_15160 [Mycobacterium sp.]|nr:hypothetical protein [Mycobacterium sp.]